ncbi:MAG TPA: glycosyltransferase [Campylobacterales bacterium]|nr:glycosyltransferase [Campylobacterales bacterium]
MKVSLIIAVYKDIEALNLILESLRNQSYKNFEVIVAEDGDSSEMADFLESKQNHFFFEIKHTTQEDNGVQKSKSQNNAIRAAVGDYLIFIDGDCLLYSNYIENHVALSGSNYIVSGRRVNTGPLFSKKLRNKEISSLWLEKNFIWQYFKIKNDAKEERHTEEGFSLKPHGWLHKLINEKRKKRFPLLGCNMSMYKSTMESINGFDEDLGNAAVAGDTDLEWRFEGIGCKIIPARFVTNQFHLYHKRSEHEYDRGVVEKMLENQQNKRYVATRGIKT